MSDFQHPAFFYRSPAEYVAGTVPFIMSALDSGRPVAVAVPAPGLAVIESALGSAASAVKMIDMTKAGRNPAGILPGVLLPFAEAHAEDVPHIVGEPVWAGRTEAEYPACAQHEALINLAFADRGATVLCPYDASRLGKRALADAERTHPLVWDAAGERISERYAAQDVIADYNLPLPHPAGAPRVLAFDRDSVATTREFTVQECARAGLGKLRAGDAELAVSELAANSVHHGGGSGVLRIWRQYGQVVCEVSDSGTLTDPLAGRLPARDSTRGGRGILLVNLLADLVRTYTTPAGTTTRAYFRRS